MSFEAPAIGRRAGWLAGNGWEGTAGGDDISRSFDQDLQTKPSLIAFPLLVLESLVAAGVLRYGCSAFSIKNVSIGQSMGPRVHGPAYLKAGARNLRATIQSGSRLFRDGNSVIKEEW